MKANMQILLYSIASIIVGVILSGFVYLNMLFLILFLFLLITFLVILVIDKFKKTSDWKRLIKPLFFSLLVILASYISTRVVEYNIISKRNQIIEKIYAYKMVHNTFPLDLKMFGSGAKKYHYSVDSSLKSFEITFRGMYGFPNSFTSEDSVWTLP